TSFPRLFSIALNQDASVADNFIFQSQGFQWRIDFRIPLREWQAASRADLLIRLPDGRLTSSPDRIMWTGEINDCFSVRSLHTFSTSATGWADPSLAVIWSSLAAPKAKFL
ncbi:hypothetical protein Dimus_028340, partial [Dionaea muscipula]